MEEPHELIEASRNGDAEARERLVERVYDDLRAVARGQLARERPGHTLQATALAHEALLRVMSQNQLDVAGKTHFLALAATSVRRVLVDHARANGAQKRGGGARKNAVNESLAGGGGYASNVLDVHAALDRLAKSSPRQARVVELRFFAGLTLEEAADELGVSRDTVKLDWRAARAWLARELE